MNITTAQLRKAGVRVRGGVLRSTRIYAESHSEPRLQPENAARTILMPIANTIIRAGKATQPSCQRRQNGDGFDSQWERDYAKHLELLKYAGEIAWWEHHFLTIHMDGKVKYKPDFWIGMPDGSIEVHEIKGHERRDAVPRFRWAAQRCRFVARFKMIRKTANGWEVYREVER